MKDPPRYTPHPIRVVQMKLMGKIMDSVASEWMKSANNNDVHGYHKLSGLLKNIPMAKD